MQDYHEFIEEVLIPEEALQKRISELGGEISHDYEGKDLLQAILEAEELGFRRRASPA